MELISVKYVYKSLKDQSFSFVTVMIQHYFEYSGEIDV